MRHGELEIPDELEAAREGERLVVFAGAGVSIDAPSDLPTFAGLCDIIGERVGKTASAPFDRFLGELKDRDVKVHEMTRKIIAVPSSKPNTVHSNVIKLFPRNESLRLVTTNFDSHFSTAACSLGFAPKVYTAPALPLGDDFTGVVHLHGSVEDLAHRLVLTDKDFGAAYLINGWARTFLQRLFEAFTVLFIGYSHQDPLVRYLARGMDLSRIGRRFAFSTSKDIAHWEQLGVSPIIYRLRRSSPAHSRLTGGLDRWVSHLETPPLDRELQIRQIVIKSRSSLRSKSDLDQLRWCFLQSSTTKYFLKNAVDWDWVEWLEEEARIARLFNRKFEPDPEDVDSLLGSWMAARMVREPANALALISRNGWNVSSKLASDILWEVCYSDDVDFACEELRLLIGLLVDRADPEDSRFTSALNHLLVLASEKQESHLTLCLFQWLTTPIGFLQGSGFARQNLQLNMVLRGDTYHLKQSWENYVRRVPEVIWLTLLLENHLEVFKLRLRDVGQSAPHVDMLSALRSRINRSDQGLGNRDPAIMVDFLADLLADHAETAPPILIAKLTSWVTGDFPLLMRLGLYGLARTSMPTASDKLKLLTESNRLFSPALNGRHETYHLVHSVYPDLTEEERGDLWDKIERGPPDGHYGPLKDERKWKSLKSSVIDGFVFFLARDFRVNDARAAAAWERLMDRNPGYDPGELSDVDFAYQSSEGNLSPVSKDELLASTPEEHLNLLLTYDPKDFFGPNRSGLQAAVGAAVTENIDWCMKLLRLLAVEGAWESDLWNVAFWRRHWSDFSDNDRNWILETISDRLLEGTPLDGLTYFVFGDVDVETIASLSGCLDSLIEVSLKIWRRLNGATAVSDEALENDDWSFLILNRPAGRVVNFWLTCASHAKQHGDAQFLENRLSGVLEEIITRRDEAAMIARAAIARDFSFTYSVLRGWIDSSFHRVTNFDEVGVAAIVFWKPFLSFSRLSPDVMRVAPRMIERNFPHLLYLPKQLKVSLFKKMVTLVYFRFRLNAGRDWLDPMLRTLSPSDMVLWARALAGGYSGIPDDKEADFWEAWILPYWQARINNVPVLFSSEEAGAMLDLCLGLGQSFPAAIDLVKAGPRPLIGSKVSAYELGKSPHLEGQPETIVDLIGWLLLHGDATNPLYLDHVAEEACRILAGTVSLKPALLELCNELSRRGYHKAEELAEFIKNAPGTIKEPPRELS